MAGNPLVDQGTLNRLKASVSFDNFPGLNITAPYLGRAAIRLALQGAASKPIPTMTGIVQSPEAYQMVEVRASLIRAQVIADRYKSQMEDSCLIGDFTVRPDAAALSPYSVLNGSIQTVSEQEFSGESEAYVVVLTGYYLINASLWN